MTVTWRTLLAEAERAVGDRQPARWIVEAASGLRGDELTSLLDVEVGERAVARLDAMVARVGAGEPVQYVIGAWGFRHLDLVVDQRVLIPRPETELVVDAVLELLPDRDPLAIVDLGTGSGAIGLALASELPLDGVAVWITDVSIDALHVASANLAGIGRKARNVRIGLGCWYEALEPSLQFDVIVSNPPYVAEGDPDVEPIVRDYEPSAALYGGPDGLDHIRTIVTGAPDHLRPGGWLVLEIGATQFPAVAALLAGAGMSDIEIRRDLTGHDRIAVARHG
ncbi:peptide chain release factor N(5)-glutamine methyltransferase [soil metagenome]